MRGLLAEHELLRVAQREGLQADAGVERAGRGNALADLEDLGEGVPRKVVERGGQERWRVDLTSEVYHFLNVLSVKTY